MCFSRVLKQILVDVLYFLHDVFICLLLLFDVVEELSQNVYFTIFDIDCLVSCCLLLFLLCVFFWFIDVLRAC